jgi:hypothetical protein
MKHSKYFAVTTIKQNFLFMNTEIIELIPFQIIIIIDSFINFLWMKFLSCISVYPNLSFSGLPNKCRTNVVFACKLVLLDIVYLEIPTR